MSNAKRRHRRRRRELCLKHRTWVKRMYALARKMRAIDPEWCFDIFRGEIWASASPEEKARELFLWFTSKRGQDVTGETF